MHGASAFPLSSRLLCTASVLLLSIAAHAQPGTFTDASDCRVQWDDEFNSYAQHYKQCGPECWSGEIKRHESQRFNKGLNRLEQWHGYCRTMSSTKQRTESAPAAGEAPAAWPVSLSTTGQSSCELIRSGEVKYKFQWKAKGGLKCYSNAGNHKKIAACCPAST